MAGTQVILAPMTLDARAHEDAHVHTVYDRIAPHFSSTRYKPWPIVAAFLDALPTGWVGLDAGTGNGKYLPLPLQGAQGRTWTIGLDRSRNLLEIARTASGDGEHAAGMIREVVWGDVLDNSWRTAVFDYALSIATIHHLATHERRRLAVERLLQCVSREHGHVLIYVWAVEQDELSKRSIPASYPAAADGCRHGSTSTDFTTLTTTAQGQDVFVPWVYTPPQAPKTKVGGGRKRNQQAAATSGLSPSLESNGADSIEAPQVFDRYYHMFSQGELLQLVHEAARRLSLHIGAPPERCSTTPPMLQGVEVIQEGWERSNYFVELRRWTQ